MEGNGEGVAEDIKYSRFKEERDALEIPWVLGLDRQNKLPRKGPQMWFWKKLLATRGRSNVLFMFSTLG